MLQGWTCVPREGGESWIGSLGTAVTQWWLSSWQEDALIWADPKDFFPQSAKPEREWPLDAAKVYMGIRKKLKPPAQ